MQSPKALLRSLWELVPALIGALIGGYLFVLVDLPAPWLSGGMLGAMLSAFVRPLPEMPAKLRDLGFLIAGTTMGSSVTPDTVALMAKAPLSFAVLAVAIVLTVALSAIWLSVVHGWRAEDGILAASPGALSTALAIAAARGGDVIGVAVVQTARLFIVVAFLPAIIGLIEGKPAVGMSAMATMSWGTAALMLAGGAVCGLLLHYLRLAAAMMLGAALFGAFMHGAGVVHGYTPMPLATAGFVLIAVMIATRTRGITWKAVGDYAAASIASFLVATIVWIALAVFASWLLNVRLGVTLLAFAPGGVEAMTLLSMSLAYDPLYVAAHHIARFMSIGLCIPLWFRVTDRFPDRD